jgi:hypothetical protein
LFKKINKIVPHGAVGIAATYLVKTFFVETCQVFDPQFYKQSIFFIVWKLKKMFEWKEFEKWKSLKYFSRCYTIL